VTNIKVDINTNR